jgi:salicylate hydroxylase
MAGQAIEDALFLTRLLSYNGVNLSNVHDALQVYNQIRLPRANKVLESSLEAGDVYEFYGPQGSDEAKLKQELESRFKWIWEVRRQKRWQDNPS